MRYDAKQKTSDLKLYLISGLTNHSWSLRYIKHMAGSFYRLILLAKRVNVAPFAHWIHDVWQNMDLLSGKFGCGNHLLKQ